MNTRPLRAAMCFLAAGRYLAVSLVARSGATGFAATRYVAAGLRTCRLATLICLAPLTGSACAETLRVRVTDLAGHPLPGTAVVVPGGIARTAPEPVIMDQRNQQFVPALVVVQRGGTVSFPNSDRVMHHVYSFSSAHTFELPLYINHTPPPVRFDRPGVVVVGCNIHDRMIGHILVVDTAAFAISGPDGTARVPNVPGSAQSAILWRPGLGEFGRYTIALNHTSGDRELAYAVPGVSATPDHEALIWSEY